MEKQQAEQNHLQAKQALDSASKEMEALEVRSLAILAALLPLVTNIRGQGKTLPIAA